MASTDQISVSLSLSPSWRFVETQPKVLPDYVDGRKDLGVHSCMHVQYVCTVKPVLAVTFTLQPPGHSGNFCRSDGFFP